MPKELDVDSLLKDVDSGKASPGTMGKVPKIYKEYQKPEGPSALSKLQKGAKKLFGGK
jgi:hypothetical protein